MHPLIARLLLESPVLTDGGWGTELQARGLPIGASADEWNLSHPDLVEQVARAYVEAGSRIILTNTFQANRLTLKAHGLADRVDAINRAGVALSRRAAGQAALVFASVGPGGDRAAFAEQVRLLAAAGADGLVLETLGDLNEALLALASAREMGLPVVVCLVFDSGVDRDRTATGATPEQAAAALTAAGADVIGANCGRGIAGFVPLCHRLRSATDRPIWIKANAGLPRIEAARLVYPATPEEFASYGPALRDAGADFVGGCCGTTPEFIRAMHRSLSALRAREP